MKSLKNTGGGDMTIRYYSINGGGIVKATVPKEVEKELKTKWFLHQKKLQKAGIKDFQQYVETVYSINY